MQCNSFRIRSVTKAYSSYLINYQRNIILNFSVYVNWYFPNVNYSKILHLYEMKLYMFSMTWSK